MSAVQYLSDLRMYEWHRVEDIPPTIQEGVIHLLSQGTIDKDKRIMENEDWTEFKIVMGDREVVTAEEYFDNKCVYHNRVGKKLVIELMEGFAKEARSSLQTGEIERLFLSHSKSRDIYGERVMSCLEFREAMQQAII